MKYTSAAKYLSAAAAECDRQTVERMNLLMQKLGRAHVGHRYIFAQGGEIGFATAKYLEAILIAAGYRVLFLTARTAGDFRECVYVGGQPLEHDEFAKHTLQVQRAVKAVQAENPNIGEFTRSELIFAIGLIAGNCRGCEFAIVHDTDCKNGAGNICQPFDICVLPVVDSEPVEVKQICQNILKGTREVIGFLHGDGTYKAVSDVCASVGCRLTIPVLSEQKIADITPSSVRFSYRGKDGFELKNSSNIAQMSALLAAETVYSLRRAGIRITPTAVLGGLSQVRLPLVFEGVSILPRVIVDTSETPGEIQYLSENLRGKEKLTVYCENVKENIINAGYFGNIKLVTVGQEGTYSEAVEAASELVKSLSPDDTALVFGSPRFVHEMKQEIRSAFDAKYNKGNL